MKVSFELTMPNVGSWNGKWTGAAKKYWHTISVRKGAKGNMSIERIHELLDGKESKSFYYNFGDGWGANVRMEIIDHVECRKRLKQSAGFCGYEWMVHSILENGKIMVKDKVDY